MPAQELFREQPPCALALPRNWFLPVIVVVSGSEGLPMQQ